MYFWLYVNNYVCIFCMYVYSWICMRCMFAYLIHVHNFVSYIGISDICLIFNVPCRAMASYVPQTLYHMISREFRTSGVNSPWCCTCCYSCMCVKSMFYLAISCSNWQKKLRRLLSSLIWIKFVQLMLRYELPLYQHDLQIWGKHLFLFPPPVNLASVL